LWNLGYSGRKERAEGRKKQDEHHDLKRPTATNKERAPFFYNRTAASTRHYGLRPVKRKTAHQKKETIWRRDNVETADHGMA